MSNLKDEKLASVISELAAEYINRESNRNSLITVTRTEVLNKGKFANILFTVLPDSEQEAALEFLRRKENDFRRFFSSKKVVGFPPRFKFMIDFGEKNRQRIDELSNQG